MLRSGEKTCLYCLALCVCVCVCHFRLLKTFPLSVFFLPSYFLMLCLLTLFLRWSSCLSFQLDWESRTTVLQAKQTLLPPLWHCLVKKKRKKKGRPGPDLRFTGVAICMLRPINFSWLSHYEHSQPEGGNAKLICVLKLLSQAGITGKWSDYPLGTWEGHV